MLKVSIVIPTYNGAKYIANTLNMALGQTYKHKEVIVVDDGSTDNTKSILRPLFDNNDMRYIYQKNQGPASARKTGLFKATGKYITFWDADDEWSYAFLEEMINYLEQNNLDWVVCDNYRKVVGLNSQTEECRYISRSDTIAKSDNLYFEFLKHDYIGSPSKVLGKIECFRKAYVGKKNFGIREDWDSWIRMTKYNFKAGVLHKPLNSYIIKKDGSNWTRRAKNRWIYDTYRLLMYYRNDYKKSVILRKAYAELMWDLSRILFYAKQNYILIIRCVVQSQLMDLSLIRMLKSLTSVLQGKRFKVNEYTAN